MLSSFSQSKSRYALALWLAGSSSCVLLGYGSGVDQAPIGPDDGGAIGPDLDARMADVELDARVDASTPAEADAALDGAQPDAADVQDAGPRDAHVIDGNYATTCAPGEECTPSCVSACTVGCNGASVCKTSCAPLTSCAVDCIDAGWCEVQCAAGSTCRMGCASSDHCGMSCGQGSSCAVDCTDATRCDVYCEKDSSCDVTCLGGNQCDGVSCADGAHCVLRCNPGDLACRLGCGSEEPKKCPGDIWVCNRDCP